MSIRQKWLDLVKEEIIDAQRIIVDPHHHFWRSRSGFPSYVLEDFNADIASGHKVEKTVFIECGAEYQQEVPIQMQPVGETKFAVELAMQSHKKKNGAKVCGIVAHVDLSLGDAVEEVLKAHFEVSQGLLRGIRHHAVWDASAEVPKSRVNPPADLLLLNAFRAGINCLGREGLSYDAWIYHPQIPQLIQLARACPETSIILNHLGTPIGVGPYANQRKEIFQIWKKSMKELSHCENITVKLGGMAMLVNGFAWDKQKLPPTSDDIVRTQKPYHMHAIECFGADRCMFESNFPVEKESVSYAVLWNAFKKMTMDFSEDEKNALFNGTACRVYRLESLKMTSST